MKKIVFPILSLILLSGCSRDAAPFDQFAQCLTDSGAVMYGSNTCPHCIAQKKAFKGSFDLINFVECGIRPGECEDAGIRAYPTWEINGEKTEGQMSLSKLAELSGCPLQASSSVNGETSY